MESQVSLRMFHNSNARHHLNSKAKISRQFHPPRCPLVIHVTRVYSSAGNASTVASKEAIMRSPPVVLCMGASQVSLTDDSMHSTHASPQPARPYMSDVHLTELHSSRSAHTPLPLTHTPLLVPLTW